MKDNQTFIETQRKINQLQKEIDKLQVKQLFSVNLSDKGTATVNESGSLVISKGSEFTYCGYFTGNYDLNGNFRYRFILDDRLMESILVDHEQAKNLKSFVNFVKKLGDFFAKHKGYNTDYTYDNYVSRLNKYIDFHDLDYNIKMYKSLKAAGFNVINF